MNYLLYDSSRGKWAEYNGRQRLQKTIGKTWENESKLIEWIKEQVNWFEFKKQIISMY